MILVISAHITNRLTYVLDFIQDCYPKLEIELIKSNNMGSIKGSPVIIEYGALRQMEESTFIQSSGLLESTQIEPFSMKWDESKRIPESFITSCEWGYDLFSYIFFQLTRYEEYIPSPLDPFGRFRSDNAIQVEAKKELSPWVDILLKDFLEHLKSKHSNLDMTLQQSSSTATMDIDVAYDYLGRDFLRSTGAFVKDLTKPKRLMERIAVLFGAKKDPAYIFDQLKSYSITYFVHVGENGPLDKSCGLSRKEFQAFLQGLSNDQIGLHPSFQSHLDLDELLFELEQLETIADQSITQSRQHYIKLILPDTYELLSQIGIEKDYSMGWPDRPGYRAGTTHPFYFFNLRTNQQTRLKLYPFCWMDAHFIFGNTDQDLVNSFDQFQQHHQEYGGDFRPIFHNNHFKNNPLLWELIQKT